jgi:hypothetical protein
MKTGNKYLSFLLRELLQIVISFLIVAFMVLILGYYFEVWINGAKEITIMTIVFYLIIGFYRLLNYLAKKSWNK